MLKWKLFLIKLKKQLLFDSFFTKYYLKNILKMKSCWLQSLLMVVNIEITSPHNLDLKFKLAILSKEKHLFFSDFPHRQKFVPNIKNKQNNPLPTNQNSIGLMPLWNGFSDFLSRWQRARKMSPYQIHSITLYLGLELRGARERVVMVQTGIAGRNSWPPDWHNQWTACWMARCNHRCLGTKEGWR